MHVISTVGLPLSTGQGSVKLVYEGRRASGLWRLRTPGVFLYGGNAFTSDCRSHNHVGNGYEIYIILILTASMIPFVLDV